MWKEMFRAHSQPTATLKDFGRSDCFLQLRIWSAGPHSFLVNIQNVSKGRALHWNVALKHSSACCTKFVNCSRNFERKCLGHMANPTATLKDFGRSDCFLPLRIWSAGPHSFFVNIQNVSKGRAALHWNIALQYECVATHALLIEKLGTHSQATATLKDFGRVCSCAYSKLVPTHFCKYSECFKRARRTALKCCTQTFICMPTKLFPQMWKETPGPTHCNSQSFWPLWLLLATAHMVSWSPFIPCKYSKCFKGARTALKCRTQTLSFICMLYQTVFQTFDGNAWGARPTHCNSQRLWPI